MSYRATVMVTPGSWAPDALEPIEHTELRDVLKDAVVQIEEILAIPAGFQIEFHSLHVERIDD